MSMLTQIERSFTFKFVKHTNIPISQSNSLSKSADPETKNRQQNSTNINNNNNYSSVLLI